MGRSQLSPARRGVSDLVGVQADVADGDLRVQRSEPANIPEIEAEGGSAIGIEADVTGHEAVDAMVTQVVREWGRVDVLVANARGGRGRPMHTKASTLDRALLHLVTGMNLFGTVLHGQCRCPTMKEQGAGKIITRCRSPEPRHH